MERLQKWAHIGEIAGAVAVVLSLLYVGYQIRENTAVQQNQTEINLYNLMHEHDSWLRDPAFVAVVNKSGDDYDALSSVELTQIEKYVATGLNVWGYAWKSFNREQLDIDEWRAWDRWFAGEMQHPAWSRTYEKYRYGYHEDFQAHIESAIRRD